MTASDGVDPTSTPRSMTRDDTITYLSSFPTVLTGFSNSKTGTIYEVLGKYSDKLLEAVVEATDGNQKAIWMVHRSLGHELSESAVWEWLVFSPLMYSQSYLLAKKLLETLHECRYLPTTTDFTRAGEEVLNQCKALIIVCQVALDVDREAFHDGPPYFAFKDDSLTELIISNPDRADHIGDIMIERSTTDAEIIKTVLGAETASLSAGAL